MLPCPKTQEHQSTCVDSWVHRVTENGHQALGRGNSLWHSACPILWSNPILLRYFTKIAPSVLPCPKTQEHQSTCVDPWVHRVPENGHQPFGHQLFGRNNLTLVHRNFIIPVLLPVQLLGYIPVIYIYWVYYLSCIKFIAFMPHNIVLKEAHVIGHRAWPAVRQNIFFFVYTINRRLIVYIHLILKWFPLAARPAVRGFSWRFYLSIYIYIYIYTLILDMNICVNVCIYTSNIYINIFKTDMFIFSPWLQNTWIYRDPTAECASFVLRHNTLSQATATSSVSGTGYHKAGYSGRC